MRILVVDDDEFDRLACRRALTRGHAGPIEFVEADSAASAIAIAAGSSFDCLLLDFRLPDMDGIELMDRLLGCSPGNAPVPVVMLTGEGDVSVAVEAMRRGAGDYLVKDVEGRYQALIPAVVQRVIREHELRREKTRAEQRHRQELSHLTQQLMAQEKAMTRRIAQSLHDRLGQTLAAMRLSFDAVRSLRAGAPAVTWQRHAERVSGLIDQAVREVRQVLVDLRPPLLDEQGLAAALDNELRSRATAHEDVELRLETQDACAAQRWPADVEYAGFMIAREALANALRHAGAATVRLQLSGTSRRLRLDIVDDGRGIEDAAAVSRPGHLGLVGMRERALAIGGECGLWRNDGGGTTVRLHWEENA